MTRADIAARLRAAGIEEAEEEAKRLFCHYAGVSRAIALAEPGADCSAPALIDAVLRREQREPLAYILGEVCFFAESYKVSPVCLIPRPETELLVEHAIGHLPQGGRFADLCTGSGCIAISTLAHRADVTADGYDISPAALTVANENAKANGAGARLRLFCADLLQKKSLYGPYDMILSNPPYVRPDEFCTLAPELHHEPRAAFLGGDDGLDFYRYFVATFARDLKEGGCFVFEIGCSQADDLRAIAAEHGFACRIEKDLCGLDRMALLTR